MGKGKNKKNTKPKTDSNPLKSVNLSFPETMAAEDMQHVIARAILEAEEIKTQNDQSQRQKEHEEFLKNLGKKECKNWGKKKLNDGLVFWNILFLKKKYVKGDRASFSLLKVSISLFFSAMRYLLAFFALLFITYVPAQLKSVIGYNKFALGVMIICCIALAFFVFTFSRFFRIASIEVDKINDRNYLLGIFASITSLISVVIAVVAVIKGV